MSCGDKIELNGKTYVAQDSVPTWERVVLVVDRGWIFAGDITRGGGRIVLRRAVWVFRWESIGFDGVLKDPKSSKATLKKLDHVVDLPSDAEIFCIPVCADWGL
jgi:hypothetical protein